MNPRDPNSDPSADPHAADRPANRLAGETSPYLLLHAHNPVDWMPWGEEALARAKSEDRPIFLSVGYSTCYWCHVMERESFSDPAVAELMNSSFVNVKLDREERPDLDEIYMTATQILTGHGGWPNSVFLTPDLAPFYAGTYFPPEDRHGRPGFRSLLVGLAQAWEHRRDEVEQQSEELAGSMRRYLVERFEAGEAPPPAAVVERAVAGLGQRFDAEFGGFGGAPKFPTPSNLELLDHVVATAGAEAEPRAAAMLAASLDAMARGGLYDQLGGGFHRYATDRAWRVPHFEKMLYDNALLVALYARHHARTGEEEAARVVRETVAFLDREMGLEGGGFASAIDAETDGHEGAFHVWRRDELEAVLGAEDFAFLAPVYGFEGPPFFEDDHYVLHLPLPLAEQAKRRRTTREELLAEMAPLRERLLAARGERKRPLTDDKVLADWNGMAIAGLAEAGRLLGETAWVERAARAADFVLAEMRPEGRLLHAWRGGEANVPAMLADYVWMVRGLLALHAASGEERWLASAVELAEEQRQHLADEADGGYFNAEEREDLLYRAKEVFDGAVPAANAVAALNALSLAEATGDEAWRQDAERTLRAAAPLVEQFTDGARTMVVATAVWHGWTGEGGGEEGADAAAPVGALDTEAAEVVGVDLEVGEAGDDGWHPFVVRLAVQDGWHVNAAEVGYAELVATSVAAESAELRAVEYPAGESWAPEGGEEIAVYRGEIEVRGEVKPAGDGAGEAAALVVTWQPCDDHRCLPAVRRRLELG